ncbi:putative RNA helicase [Streptomyces sp. Tu6071]|nr:putative RNA helicase [Streptomyces sp. Tu6071]
MVGQQAQQLVEVVEPFLRRADGESGLVVGAPGPAALLVVCVVWLGHDSETRGEDVPEEAGEPPALAEFVTGSGKLLALVGEERGQAGEGAAAASSPKRTRASWCDGR